ncbi:MAG: hypothetical protein B7Z31_07640 [Rhodobacterales bacterium 12-65-15]|nr:MAG: hypothetical protein B7Z31_07640 [Rhodobacterales bacterium 12-65-15]
MTNQPQTDPSEPPKAVLVSAMRNEAAFLLEWVAYHRVIGFSRIVVCANPSSDGTDALLAALDAAGAITYLPTEPGPDQSPLEAANAAFEATVGYEDGCWYGWLDADEFMNIHSGSGRVADLPFFCTSDQVTGFAGIGQERPALAPGHGLTHRDFLGGNGRPLLAGDERTEAWLAGKPLGHSNLAAKGEAGAALAQINHCAVRTPEHYRLKQARGRGYVKAGSSGRVRYDERYFSRFDQNEVEDHTILRWEAEVTSEISGLMQVPSVARAQGEANRLIAAELAGLYPEAARKVAPTVAAPPLDAPPVAKDEAGLRIAYLLSALAPSRQFTILDIGANPVNPPRYRRLLEAGGCHVVGFEPQEAAFQALQTDAGPNESYINAAVGKPGKGFLHLYPFSGLVSLFPLSLPSLQFLGRYRRKHRMPPTVEVDLRGIDDIVEITRIDMLKLDVQGAELDILTSGRRKLADAIIVIPELRYYRLYQNEPLMGEVDSELRRQGFVLHKFLPQTRVHLKNSQTARLNTQFVSTQLVDGDAVYIRDMEDITRWSDDQLRFLALAAATVFNSHDLALRCMDHLVARGVLPAECPADYLAHLPAKLLRPVAAVAEIPPALPL